MNCCIHDVCSLDVGEPCANSAARVYETWVAFASNITDFGADVFALSIAICPNVEILTPASFGLDVFGDAFLSVFNERLNPRSEQSRWVT